MSTEPVDAIQTTNREPALITKYRMMENGGEEEGSGKRDGEMDIGNPPMRSIMDSMEVNY